MNFSLEVGPHSDLDTLPPVKDVYVTMLPGGDYKETAQKSDDLVKKSSSGTSLVLSPFFLALILFQTL